MCQPGTGLHADADADADANANAHADTHTHTDAGGEHWDVGNLAPRTHVHVYVGDAGFDKADPDTADVGWEAWCDNADSHPRHAPHFGLDCAKDTAHTHTAYCGLVSSDPADAAHTCSVEFVGLPDTGAEEHPHSFDFDLGRRAHTGTGAWPDGHVGDTVHPFSQGPHARTQAHTHSTGVCVGDAVDAFAAAHPDPGHVGLVSTHTGAWPDGHVGDTVHPFPQGPYTCTQEHPHSFDPDLGRRTHTGTGTGTDGHVGNAIHPFSEGPHTRTQAHTHPFHLWFGPNLGRRAHTRTGTDRHVVGDAVDAFSAAHPHTAHVGLVSTHTGTGTDGHVVGDTVHPFPQGPHTCTQEHPYPFDSDLGRRTHTGTNTGTDGHVGNAIHPFSEGPHTRTQAHTHPFHLWFGPNLGRRAHTRTGTDRHVVGDAVDAFSAAHPHTAHVGLVSTHTGTGTDGHVVGDTVHPFPQGPHTCTQEHPYPFDSDLGRRTHTGTNTGTDGHVGNAIHPFSEGPHTRTQAHTHPFHLWFGPNLGRRAHTRTGTDGHVVGNTVDAFSAAHPHTAHVGFSDLGRVGQHPRPGVGVRQGAHPSRPGHLADAACGLDACGARHRGGD